jgi:hypothetical protein
MTTDLVDDGAFVSNTPSSAAAQAHRTAVASPPGDLAAFLQEALGQRLTAHIVGVTDPKTIGRWATRERTPRGEHEQRLRDTVQIFRLLNSEESDHTVRAWFTGMNPHLGDESPAGALAEGRSRDVLMAAKAFLSDG